MISKPRNDNKRYAVIPDLSARMVAVGATNMALAEAAGVSLATVAMLRCGKRRVEKYNAECILQALSEF